MTGLGSGSWFETGDSRTESGMAGDNVARRTVGVTRIRIAGVDGPPVADASMSQLYPAMSRQRPSQLTPPESRLDRAATQARRLGNPVAPDRICEP
jgi:hypothetical protein